MYFKFIFHDEDEFLKKAKKSVHFSGDGNRRYNVLKCDCIDPDRSK